MGVGVGGYPADLECGELIAGRKVGDGAQHVDLRMR